VRAQTAIEFLLTYSFLFIILGVAVSILIFIATAPVATVPSQCSSFGGLACNFVAIYSNRSAAYSLITLSITNSQSVPINITNVSVMINGVSSQGACTPYFLYPGQDATCVANMTTVQSFGALLQGFYKINARYCNSGISSISKGNCTYEKVAYSGSFSATVLKSRSIIFSVVASISPKSLQQVPFNTIPVLPRNYTIVQNGDWVSNVSSGVIAYSFGTIGYIGNTYLGRNVVAFPQSLSALGNSNVACSPPYNSTLSVASTTLYISSSVTANVAIVTSNAMEVYYKQIPVTGSTVWQNVFSGAAWNAHGATQYGPNSITLNKGLYSFEMVWSDVCTSGVQVFRLTGIPN
jgi:hypothetical protein